MFDSDDESKPDEAQPDPAPEPDLPAGLPPTARDLESVAVERLADDICTMAGHLAAATCRWLELIGEFDHRKGWAGPGITTCAYWLSWRCGLGSVAAREHVRVARALRSMPSVRAEFAAGRLSYSKVRAITRISKPELEERLVQVALTCTAAHMEAVVRTYRRTTAPARRRNGGAARSTSTFWDDDGFLILRARLTPEEGALVLAALDSARHQLDRAERSASGDENAQSASGSVARPSPADECCETDAAEAFRSSLTDALVAVASASLAAGPVDTSGADRFQVMVHADLEQLATVLPQGADGAGTDDNRADAADRLADRPNPDQPCAHDGHDDHGHDDHGHDGTGSDLRRSRSHIKNGPAIHPATLALIACDAALRVFVHGPDGSPRDTGRLHRLITAALRRLVEDRDGGCRYPACPRRRHLHAHHIKHWADGGTTDLDNLILLCAFHHRLVHQFAYSIAIVAPGVFAFDRPDGSRIEPAPAMTGHGRLDDLPAALHHAPPITPSTMTPTWAGERVDLGYVVSFLIPDDNDPCKDAAHPAAAA